MYLDLLLQRILFKVELEKLPNKKYGQGYYCMEKNKVYIGKLQNKPVKFLGIQFHEDLQMELHQFEYIKPNGMVVGYGQSSDQVISEEYKLLKLGTILHGCK
jgi:hypothetical protein